MGEAIGNCSKCGSDAGWNTPCISPTGDILCPTCADESEILVQGVEQYRDDEGNPVRLRKFSKQGVSLWAGHNDHFAAWYDKGGTSYPLTEEEKNLSISDPEVVINGILAMLSEDKVRCTGCEETISSSEIGGFPLFAGIVCKPCWHEHKKAIEKERREGKVCRMCRKPWLLCCC